MAIVTNHEVKKAFDEILYRVEQGEDIVITKQDRPVARMIPESKRDLDQVRRAVGSIRAHRLAMLERGFGPLTDAEIRTALQEGRR
jgi:prevent-host-death family protein